MHLFNLLRRSRWLTCFSDKILLSTYAFFQGVDIKKFVKIGRPGYRVTKQRDAENGQQSLLFEVTFKYKPSLDKSLLLPELLARHKSLQNQIAIVTQVDYPEIAEGIFPRHRFMSAYEQKVYFCSHVAHYIKRIM